MEAINEVNELLTTKLCSPVIIYGVIVVISLIGIYLCRSNLSRYNTLKMDNLHKLFTMQELKFLIVLGVIMFGLCQYNKTTLAWVFLLFPIIYVVIQNLIIHIHVSSAIQSAPKEVELQQMPQYMQGGAQIVPQDTQQSQPPQPPMVPATKQSPDMPVSSRSSQVLGGSSDFGGVSGGGGNFAYF